MSGLPNDALGHDEDVCGWSYDHDLDLVYEGDDGRAYWCRTCGAEIIEEADAVRRILEEGER